MQTILVVVRAFGAHAIGDLVVSPGDIAQIIASEHAAYVVRTTAATVSATPLAGA